MAAGAQVEIVAALSRGMPFVNYCDANCSNSRRHFIPVHVHV